MSPARARTSRDGILVAARALLEEGGLDAVTMQAVADRVGVRAPSLYKHVANRRVLITALADAVTAELATALAPALDEPDPADALRRMAATYRRFAGEAPASYQLLFTPEPPGPGAGVGPSPSVNADAASGLLQVTARLAGEDRALEAARFVVAFAHGFVSMEAAGAFRLGGDVDAAFEFGVEALIRGLVAPPNPPPARQRPPQRDRASRRAAPRRA